MKYLIVGGAGFIGSYCSEALLQLPDTTEIRIYDNFSSGKMWHLDNIINDQRVKVIDRDIYDDDIFSAAVGIDCAFLFAANPDIAKAVSEPSIDFHQGTALTQIVLEAIRLASVPRLLYASGSGVYGEFGSQILKEDWPRMRPISTYGASKLSCEALICSYSHMFGIKSSSFRFGNVVGGKQTHGVAYDFLLRLSSDSSKLSILGDGSQSKPYIHIDDITSAMIRVLKMQNDIYEVYNVAPNDYATVSEIAEIVISSLGISSDSCELHYTGGDRGWKGDVPIVRLDSQLIRSLGWSNEYSSIDAIRKSVCEMIINFGIKNV